ncbi:MAG: polysaccharide deacetylase family protein [Bacillota bacterium]
MVIRVRLAEIMGVALLACFLVSLAGGARSVTVTTKRRLPIYGVKTEEKVVAFSFDAAWGADKTEQILATLREHGVRTTFFLVTFWVRKYPEMTKRIADEGHEIGLHSSTHPDMKHLPPDRIREELRENIRAIKEITGKDPKLFRPPFGSYSDRLIQIAEDEMGLLTIQWSLDSLDWKKVTRQDIVSRILNSIEPGDIVLFHNNGEYTADALGEILTEVKARGYRVVPISEILYSPPYYIDHQGKQVKIEPQ